MPKIFFDIKQRDYPALGASPDRVVPSSPIYPSRFFSSHPQGSTMDTPHKDKYAVDLPSIIKSLKHQIQSTKNYIEFYLPDIHSFEEILKGKEQLRQQEKLLSEMEEALRCQ